MMSAGKFKLNRADHPDVQVRNVLAQAPNGEWLLFDTLLEAKTILLAAYHKNIFHSIKDFEQRLSPGAKSQLADRFGTTSMNTLWEQLQLTARNPIRRHEAVAAADSHAKTYGRRVRRPRVLKYRFDLPKGDQAKIDVFYRMPPQARSIIELVEEYCKEFTEPVILETELKAYIEKHADKLYTKQDPWRIFQYYRGKLIAAGFLRFAR
jgi:hypothetical protein